MINIKQLPIFFDSSMSTPIMEYGFPIIALHVVEIAEVFLGKVEYFSFICKTESITF